MVLVKGPDTNATPPHEANQHESAPTNGVSSADIEKPYAPSSEFESSLGHIDKLLDGTAPSAGAPLSSQESIAPVPSPPPVAVPAPPNSGWESSFARFWRARLFYVASSVFTLAATVGMAGMLLRNNVDDKRVAIPDPARANVEAKTEVAAENNIERPKPSKSSEDGDHNGGRPAGFDSRDQESGREASPVLTDTTPTHAASAAKQESRLSSDSSNRHSADVQLEPQRSDDHPLKSNRVAAMSASEPQIQSNKPNTHGHQSQGSVVDNTPQRARRLSLDDSKARFSASADHTVSSGTAAQVNRPNTVQTSSDTDRIQIRYKPISEPTFDTDARANVETPVGAMSIKAMPLNQFLRLQANIGNIPITVDPRSLEMLGISASTAIDINSDSTNVGQLLNSILKPRGLSYQLSGAHLLVVAPNLIDSQLRTGTHDIADLVSGDPRNAKRLVNQLTTVVAPANWDSPNTEHHITDDGDKLRITTEFATHWDIHSFLQRLRQARGLPIRSKKRSTSFSIIPRSKQIEPDLRRFVTVTVTNLTERTFDSVLNELESQSGISILVDWVALADSGHAFNLELSSYLANKVPLRDALQSLLDPIDLGYRAINDHTLQITSNTTLNSEPQLEFYALSDLIGSEQLAGEQLADNGLARITRRVLQMAGIERMPPGCGIAYDSPSRHLLVLLPSTHQAAIAQYLRASP